jgi:hypothetical protein
VGEWNREQVNNTHNQAAAAMQHYTRYCGCHLMRERASGRGNAGADERHARLSSGSSHGDMQQMLFHAQVGKQTWSEYMGGGAFQDPC